MKTYKQIEDEKINIFNESMTNQKFIQEILSLRIVAKTQSKEFF